MAHTGQERSEARSVMHDLTGYLVLVLAIITIGPFQFGFHLVLFSTKDSVLRCRADTNDILGRAQRS